MQYEWGCAVRVGMCSTSGDVQYKSGTSLVQARMCSMNQARCQYKQECVVQSRNITSTSKDVQYDSGTSSVQEQMCNMNQVPHQYERGCAV